MADAYDLGRWVIGLLRSGESWLESRAKPALAGIVTAGSVEDFCEALPIALVGVGAETGARGLCLRLAAEVPRSRKEMCRGGGAVLVPGGAGGGGGGSSPLSCIVLANREAKAKKCVFRLGQGRRSEAGASEKLLAVMSVALTE